MGALESMRVLDMTQYEAGTSCTQALGFMGATVTKIERPGTGDPGRGVARGTDNAPYFLNWNSNKRSIALDLQKPEGRDLFLQMVSHYDVFVENYGPGVIEKLDIGYDVMKKINPGIIYARLKGFGLSGPYSDYKSYDMIAQAAGGAFSVTGNADGPPMRPGYCVGDSGTGMQLAFAITAAFVHRQKTGEGQEIEISMQEALTYYMRTPIANGSNWGQSVSPRNGNRAVVPTDLFPCKPFGPNDWVYVMAQTTRMWDTFCAVLERTDFLTDDRWNDVESRRQNGDSLYEEICKWTRERTKHEVMAELGAAGVPCSAVMDTVDLFNDPHLKSRDFIKTVSHPTEGDLKLLGFAPIMSEHEVDYRPAPLLGEHTKEILNEDLDLGSEAVEQLIAEGVVDQSPVDRTGIAKGSAPRS
tara:strand:- start:572 stop:1813 length:1242 start_codon:yes stop_codon:yes gene_type:complete